MNPGSAKLKAQVISQQAKEMSQLHAPPGNVDKQASLPAGDFSFHRWELCTGLGERPAAPLLGMKAGTAGTIADELVITDDW